MIPRISKILYATDLSRNSAYAYRYAANLARGNDAEIIILHVVEEVAPSTQALLNSALPAGQSYNQIFAAAMQKGINEIKARLKHLCEQDLTDDPQCATRVIEIEVVPGEPAQLIIEKSKTFGCDAIVMGSHAKGAISSAILGSVAERVVRKTKIPLFLIPLPEEDPHRK
jgi:nucleotide-binding universal stress UspA family protein